MSGIEIFNGTLETHKHLLQDLLEQHVEELTTNKDLMKLNPDWDLYDSLEKSGKLFSLFVKKDNEIIGYSVNFLNYHLHYSDLCYASNDVLFLKKEYRNSDIGRELIARSEQKARDLGAAIYFVHAKHKTTLDKLLPLLGYQIQDIIHSKVL